MITLIHDPIGLAESVVIIASLAFYAWWFSPAQRAQRRRQRARDRAQLRRAFANPTRTCSAALSAPPDQKDQK